MSRTTFYPGDANFPSSLFPTQTANDFNTNFNNANNQYNAARDAINTGQKIGIGIGVTVAVLAFLSVIAFVVMITRKKHRRRQQLEQNEKMYEHHRVDPPGINEAVIPNMNGGNGYEMGGKSELGGVGVGKQYSGEVNGAGRVEATDSRPGGGQVRELGGDGERRELGGKEMRGELDVEERRELDGTEVRGELGTGEGFANGTEKVKGRRNDPAELQ